MNNNYDYDKYHDNKKKKKNLIISLVLIGIIITLIVGIFLVKNNLKEEEIPNDNQNNDPVFQEPIEEKQVSIIDVGSKTRPFAVMINCHNGALPQSGLDKAYIVYELMVEGGITRMMALFKDVDVSKIGSVRSARTQYLDYVYENDAIYAHAGGAKDALERISREGISDIDVDGVYGIRDTSLNRSWEHTLFSSTNLLNKAITNKSIRKETNLNNLLTYQADNIDMSSYKDIKDANNVSIKYSDYRTSNYVYDKEKQVYLRSMNNTKNIDLVTGEQYEVKNIIVYSVKYSNYTYNGYSAYQKIDNVGSGEGYYITNGKAIPITWEKKDKNSQTKYIVKETGKELVVNDGNTYIQIYPTSGSLVIN